MTQENFIYWLQGYLTSNAPLDAQIIKDKLQTLWPQNSPTYTPYISPVTHVLPYPPSEVPYQKVWTATSSNLKQDEHFDNKLRIKK